MTNKAVSVDAIIFGGGIAGLWILRSLRAKGYSAVLLESGRLGGGQTMASQGVLHGGLKYALNGKLTDSSEAIRDMPGRWRSCLEGQGEIDLSGVRLRSDHQLLWSAGKLGSRITSFFASKTLAGRIEKLKVCPDVLRSATASGVIYRLEEPVIDVPDLIKVLAGPVHESIVHYEKARFTGTGVCVDGASIDASRILFAAGEGNQALMAKAGLSSFPQQQLRPLHQVMVAHPALKPLYAVCMGVGKKPVLVSTAHETSDGTPVWYLGGDLAESGVARSAAEQVATAQAALGRLFPGLKLDGARWRTLEINRAEPVTPDGEKPAGAYCQAFDRYMVCWPTKLVMAPLLGDEVLRLMPAAGGQAFTALSLPKPEMAQPAWSDL